MRPYERPAGHADVTFIVNGLARAGAELMLLRLVEAITRRGYGCAVVMLQSSDTDFKLLTARVPAENTLRLALQRPWLLPRELWRMFRFLRTQQAGLVQTWMYHSDLLGGLVSRLAGRASLFWGVRNGDLAPERLSRLTRLTVAVCARLSNRIPKAVIFCSHQSRAAHEAVGYDQDKGLVIPNGVSVSKEPVQPADRQALRASLGVSDDEKLVGFVGRYSPVKNPAGFLNMAAEVSAAIPSARFMMVGRGNSPDNAELVRALRSRAIEDRFLLLGERDDLHRLYPAMDLLVQASLAEAFPNVLLEAMAAGVPCVATDVGDSSQIIGQLGRLVPPGDPCALAASVLAELTQPEAECQARRAAQSARIAEQFDIEQVADAYLAAWGLPDRKSAKCAG